MSTEQMTVKRFQISQRIEHGVLLVAFFLLGITGIPQKFSTWGFSQAVIAVFGGIETTRIIHHISAVVFGLQAIYHFAMMGYKMFVLRQKASMAPGKKDVIDGIKHIGYNLNISKNRPKMGRYNFMEKMEYWAVVWGLVLMGLTGFMLWNPVVVAKILPGVFIPAAKAAHGAEAILAVAAIFVWHFYSVHLKGWNWSMIKGTLTRHEMEEEHAAELEEIENGEQRPLPSKEVRAKRMNVFMPVTVVLSLLLVFAVYKFVTFEDTAIVTLPPAERAVVYVKVTATATPTKAPTATPVPPTPVPTGQPTVKPAALTWQNGVSGLFDTYCKSCHGTSGGLSVASYAEVMKGGSRGVIIKAGDVAGSSLVNIMTGTHPVVFSDADLAKIKSWIQAGALEK